METTPEYKTALDALISDVQKQYNEDSKFMQDANDNPGKYTEVVVNERALFGRRTKDYLDYLKAYRDLLG